MRIYTIEEVAAILKLTRRTLYSYIKAGQLRASKIGRYWRVSEAALNEFIERGTNA